MANGNGGSVGAVEEQSAEFDEPLRLRSGAELGRWRMAYETYGEPNEDLSNAVLVCHALSGGHHAAGFRKDNPEDVGWWDNMIGPGKPIDTDRFFVVSPNNLGGCHGTTGPGSVNPATGEPYGREFPIVTVRDWVESQRLLADRLGIGRWFAVVGGSLGGMQGLQWAQLHPGRVDNVVAVAVTWRLTAQNIAFNDIARNSIMRDPVYQAGGNYKSGELLNGLAVARMLAHVTYISDDLMAQKFGRQRHSGASASSGYGIEYQVESYLRRQGDRFARKFDPNTYLLMTRALDYFDLSEDHGGDLEKALAGVKSRILLLSFKSDWRFSPAMARELLKALLANRVCVSYAEVQTPHGHDSFLLRDPQYHRAVRTFLDRAWSARRK